MAILVLCLRCSMRLSVPESAAGKHVRCPKPGCGTLTPIPAFIAAEEVAVVEAKPAQPKLQPPEDTRPETRRRRGVDDRPRTKKRDDEHDFDFDRPLRKTRPKKSGLGTGVMAAIVLGSLFVLAGLGFGIYALMDKSSGPGPSPDSASDSAKGKPPAGWQQYTYEKDGFRAYFPAQPTVTGMGGPAGPRPAAPAGRGKKSGPAVTESFTMYLPGNIGQGTQIVVVVFRFSSPPSQAEQKQAINSLRDGRSGPQNGETKRVRWLGVEAEQTSGLGGTVRIAVVDSTIYVANISDAATSQPVSPSEEKSFFDNFELIK